MHTATVPSLFLHSPLFLYCLSPRSNAHSDPMRTPFPAALRDRDNCASCLLLAWSRSSLFINDFLFYPNSVAGRIYKSASVALACPPHLPSPSHLHRRRVRHTRVRGNVSQLLSTPYKKTHINLNPVLQYVRSTQNVRLCRVAPVPRRTTETCAILSPRSQI